MQYATIYVMDPSLIGSKVLDTLPEILSYASKSNNDHLLKYIFRVLDALCIKNGPAHSELMIVGNQPILLETAARLPGSIDISAYSKALGYNQLMLWVLSCINPDLFLILASQKREQLKYHSSCIFLISSEEGKIINTPNLELINELETLHSFKIIDSGHLNITNNLFNSPGFIFLLSKDKSGLSLERAKVRKLEPFLYKKMIEKIN